MDQYEATTSTGRWQVEYLQCVELELLASVPGIRLELVENDWMGFARVDVIGPTREAVIEYVRAEWGDDDEAWFAEYVIGRVREVQA